MLAGTAAVLATGCDALRGEAVPENPVWLHRPGGALQERGDYEGWVRKSLYTRAVLHPGITAVVAAGAAGLLLTRRSRGRRPVRVGVTS